MTRITTLIALLVFALPISAAPVPKAVKAKSSAPPLTGTKWSGVHTVSDLGTIEYEFKDGGTLDYLSKGAASRTTGTWKQDGDTLTWSVNKGYATDTLTWQDGVYEGTASNVKGVTWKVKLTPIEKK